MTTRKFDVAIQGFSGGLNTESSSLQVFPGEFLDGTVNIELFKNTRARPRRAIDYVGLADDSSFETVLRSNIVSEIAREAPNAITASLRAPNGNVLKRVFSFMNNEFRIYPASSQGLRNVGIPDQTLDLTTHVAGNQKFFAPAFVATDNRLYFAGRHLQTGYIQVATDNTTFELRFIDVFTRDTSTGIKTSRVQRTISGTATLFEALQEHTSTTANRPGDGTEGTWQQFWQQVDNPVPSGTDTWAVSTAYKTNITNPFPQSETITNTIVRPEGLDFFAGRLWLGFNNTVHFSQVIQDSADTLGAASRFHQAADPLDIDDPTLAPADGGTILLSGSSSIKQILKVGQSIFIGTATSVSQIAGPDGSFKANDFSVTEPLDDGIPSPFSMVRADQVLYVFANNDVWVSDRGGDSLTPSSIGFDSLVEVRQDVGGGNSRVVGIKSLYSEIPRESKASSRALYFARNKSLYYFFNKKITDFELVNNPFEQPGYVTNYLRFDVATGAWHLHELQDAGLLDKPYIAAPFIVPSVSIDIEQVTDSAGVLVTTISGDPVTLDVSDETDSLAFIGMRRQIIGETPATSSVRAFFGILEAVGLQDWLTVSQFTFNYEAKLFVGHSIMGAMNRKSAGNYLNVVFEKVESGVVDAGGNDLTPGGCLLSQGFQWAVSTISKKFSQTKRQIYFPQRFGQTQDQGADDGHNHVFFKDRVRGRGQVIQLVFEKDGSKDFVLAGFNLSTAVGPR